MKRGKIIVWAFFALIITSGLLSGLRPQTAFAHPLGNFTVNTLSVIEVAAEQIKIDFFVDMAEIPTFQERATIDVNSDDSLSQPEQETYLNDRVQELLDGFFLQVNEASLDFQVSSQSLEFLPGQGNLPTTRIALSLLSDMPLLTDSENQKLYFRNDNYVQRRGMNQIVMRSANGTSLVNSTASEFDETDGLRVYPEHLLKNPPRVNDVEAIFTISSTGKISETPATNIAIQETESSDFLTSLITRKELGLPIMGLAILVSIGLGAIHASSPGHGKTVMAAYLVGNHGTARHAVFLGGVVTVSHTLGVLGLGLVVLFASHLIAPDVLYPWLGLTSGVIIIVVGIWLLVSRIHNNHATLHSHHDESGAHPHSHVTENSSFFARTNQVATKVFHGHTHDLSHAHHDKPHEDGNRLQLTWRSLTALGIVGGLVPSASALIILLAAISLQRIGLGIVLLLAFSMGMAIVLSGLGLALVYAGRLLGKFHFQDKRFVLFSRLMPYMTALVVLFSGIAVASRAVVQIGF